MISFKGKNGGTVKCGVRMDGVEILRVKSIIEGVTGMGYDALFAILELETCGGEVWWFYDVPEHIWYKWRSAENQTAFFYTHIAGKFRVEQIL